MFLQNKITDIWTKGRNTDGNKRFCVRWGNVFRKKEKIKLWQKTNY